MMFSVLIDVGKLEWAAKTYYFTLAPDNLYYDIQGRAYVKTMDVYGADGEYSQEDFLWEHKSLIGCTLIKSISLRTMIRVGRTFFITERFIRNVL